MTVLYRPLIALMFVLHFPVACPFITAPSLMDVLVYALMASPLVGERVEVWPGVFTSGGY